MAAFFTEQSDFILFLYGLAFILLGITSFSIARQGVNWRSWRLLGGFGLVHGATEWLDLSALVIYDSDAFAAFRLVLLAISFFFLMKFARRELARRYELAPGIWIYIPIVFAVVITALAHGLADAAAMTRYVMALPAAVGASLVFALYAREFAGLERRLAIAASVGMALYAITAGLVVSMPGTFWPADSINAVAFKTATGVPITLLRGLLACVIAASIWGIWGQSLITKVGSARYARFLHQQFLATLIVMALIISLGWALTEYFGIVHKRNLKLEAQNNLDLVATSLLSETRPLDAVARAFAGTPNVRSALAGETGSADRAELATLLKLNIEAAGASDGLIVDRGGTIVTAVSRNADEAPRPQDIAAVVQQAIVTGSGHQLDFDPRLSETEYYAAVPVRGMGQNILGAIVLKRPLRGFAGHMGTLGSPTYLVDPQGIVTLSNQNDALGRSIRPEHLPSNEQLAKLHGTIVPPSLTDSEVRDDTWQVHDGVPVYVRRIFFENSDWSLVTLTPVEGIFATRVLGIAITLLSTIMVLIYVLGRERAVYDHVQMDRRLELEELARDLDHKASTDPLTGLANRLKFDELLNREIARSRRLNSPLSLILYDLDYFKQINDNFGHQAGDDVLTQLSRYVLRRLRATDALARWGGEEFALLAPHSDGREATQLAEILRADVATTGFGPIEQLTCSFGVAELAPGEQADNLIARADRALYEAKVSGRNRVVLAPMPSVGTEGDFGSAA